MLIQSSSLVLVQQPATPPVGIYPCFIGILQCQTVVSVKSDSNCCCWPTSGYSQILHTKNKHYKLVEIQNQETFLFPGFYLSIFAQKTEQNHLYKISFCTLTYKSLAFKICIGNNSKIYLTTHFTASTPYKLMPQILSNSTRHLLKTTVILLKSD